MCKHREDSLGLSVVIKGVLARGGAMRSFFTPPRRSKCAQLLLAESTVQLFLVAGKSPPDFFLPRGVGEPNPTARKTSEGWRVGSDKQVWGEVTGSFGLYVRGTGRVFLPGVCMCPLLQMRPSCTEPINLFYINSGVV